ncbi:hypothetical protein [Ensifer adhaerens]
MADEFDIVEDVDNPDPELCGWYVSDRYGNKIYGPMSKARAIALAEDLNRWWRWRFQNDVPPPAPDDPDELRM